DFPGAIQTGDFFLTHPCELHPAEGLKKNRSTRRRSRESGRSNGFSGRNHPPNLIAPARSRKRNVRRPEASRTKSWESGKLEWVLLTTKNPAIPTPRDTTP